jgi:hypothetical protein
MARAEIGKRGRPESSAMIIVKGELERGTERTDTFGSAGAIPWRPSYRSRPSPLGASEMAVRANREKGPRRPIVGVGRPLFGRPPERAGHRPAEVIASAQADAACHYWFCCKSKHTNTLAGCLCPEDTTTSQLNAAPATDFCWPRVLSMVGASEMPERPARRWLVSTFSNMNNAINLEMSPFISRSPPPAPVRTTLFWSSRRGTGVVAAARCSPLMCRDKSARRRRQWGRLWKKL